MQETLERHFTATTYVVDNNRVLLLEHKKIGTWLPPGGHLEKNELPHETALREIIEETGLDIKLITDQDYKEHEKQFEKDSQVNIAPQPWKILLEKIEENHYHIDLIYIAITKNNKKPKGEEHKFKWFDLKELEQTNQVIPNVKYLAILAIKKLTQKE